MISVDYVIIINVKFTCRMTWLKVCKYMHSLTSIDIRPFLDLKIEAGLISLYKNQEAVVEITVLTHFLL